MEADHRAAEYGRVAKTSTSLLPSYWQSLGYKGTRGFSRGYLVLHGGYNGLRYIIPNRWTCVWTMKWNLVDTGSYRASCQHCGPCFLL